ncbi:hypothetical protein ACHAXS_001509 [Conticribra weissflogii]
MIDCISGYKFFNIFDISMQYYICELDEPSQELCVIVTPFGKYKYKCFPMGTQMCPRLCPESHGGSIMQR